MTNYLPKFKPGDSITKTASATITGGQVVEVTGSGTVGPAGADSAKWVGVAGHDAANGKPVTIFCGGVQRPLASGTVTAGDTVECAAAGKVILAVTPTVSTIVGIALTTATDGLPVEIAFVR